MGPGVGGMKQWETYRPMDSATVIATELVLVRFTMALRMGFRTTKPESQNTGMEMIQPMSMMASSGFFCPTSLTTLSLIFRAAPVFSRTRPISAPKIITIPMLEKVPEKPAPMVEGISFSSRESSARIRDTPRMERKGWIFSLLIARIITTIAMTNAIMSAMPDNMEHTSS